MSEQIDYGECIQSGHNMKFVKVTFNEMCNRIIHKKCSRCGYASEKEATFNESMAITLLGIDY